MEILKFETSAETPSQLERLSHIMENAPNIVEWCVDYFLDQFFLSVKGINIKALDIINALGSEGIVAAQVYEE